MPRSRFEKARKLKSTPNKCSIPAGQPKFPSPIGQQLDSGRFFIEKYFNTEIFRNFFHGTYRDNDRIRWIFIKMKHCHYPEDIEQQRWEFKIYKALEQTKGMKRIPKCYYLGPVLWCYEAMALELLGPSVHDLWYRCEKHLSIRALAQLGYQLVCLMKYFHDRGLIYQNINPDHFLYGPSGLDRWSWLYAVDLKWCKFWCRTTTSGKTEHVPLSKRSSEEPIRLGTPIRYQSLNAHQGIGQSRRDDLESIGYLLVYLFEGDLPWIKLERIENIAERHRQIFELKRQCLETSILFQNMLPEFEQYMRMVCALKFDQQPDYQKLGRLFQDVQKKIGFTSIYQLYDWDGLHRPIR